MQGGGAVIGGEVFQLAAQAGVRQHFRDAPALDDRRNVLPGAADQQREFSGGLDRVDSAVGFALVFGGGEGLVRRDDVDQVVRGGGALGGTGLGGADVHVAVDLAAVRADDLAVERVCQLDRQGRLAAGSRAEQHDQRRSAGLGARGRGAGRRLRAGQTRRAAAQRLRRINDRRLPVTN